MPGLIETELDNTKNDLLPVDPNAVKLAKTTSFDPNIRAVGSDETVAGQLDKLLAKDSPLVTRARAGAAERANARGLLNSSIAAGAGEAAAIDAALPIASADASTYDRAAGVNQQTTNAALQFGASSLNQAGQVNAATVNEAQRIKQQTEAQSRLQSERATQETGLTKLRGEIETGLQSLRGNQATQLAQIESNYKQLMQANASAASLFNESMQQISTILRDPNTSAEQKASAVTSVNSLLESSLAVAGAISNLDLLDLLTFEGP